MDEKRLRFKVLISYWFSDLTSRLPVLAHTFWKEQAKGLKDGLS